MNKIIDLTWDQLEACGQLKTFTTPENVTRDIQCPKCGGYFVCTYDFNMHKLVHGLGKLPWVEFKSGNGWWIYSDDAPYLREYVQNGHTIIGKYKYYLYGNNKCIGRSLYNG